MLNLLPKSVLLSTPSSKDGVSDSIELTHRILGCELIQEASILLKLPQVVAVTGQNIMNRFFYRKSLLKFDVFTVSMGCVLLASKVEEMFKTLREVIYVFHRIYLRRRGFRVVALELGGEQYTAWKSELITMEMYVLKELGFSLYTIMDHPHKYLLYFVKMLSGSEDLAQTAWSYLNDSMRLSLSLQFKAEVIACATIHLAAVRVGVALPEDPGAQWWTVLGADRESMLCVAERILSLYGSGLPVLWVEPLAAVKYLADIDSEFAREAAETQPAVVCKTSVAPLSFTDTTITTNVPAADERRAGNAVSIASTCAVEGAAGEYVAQRHPAPTVGENVSSKSTASAKLDVRYATHRASSGSRYEQVRSPARGGEDRKESADYSDKRRRYDSRERGHRVQHRSRRDDSRERDRRRDTGDNRNDRRNSTRRSRSPEDRRYYMYERSESRERRRT